MFPGVFGFEWTAGNLIFLGIFNSVICLVLGAIAVAIVRGARDFANGKQDELRWDDDFEELPPTARACRHAFTGEIKHRVCPNGFDCRECTPHSRLLERGDCVADLRAQERSASGFEIEAECMYHRGHTWVREEGDGTVTVGLDDFASRLVGPPDDAELPAVGSRLVVNGSAWNLKRGSATIRILCPVDGEVVATGGAGQGWYLRIRPLNGAMDTRHLLRGGEVSAWIANEMERLQLALSNSQLGASLADGGLPVQDFTAANPEADWDSIYAEFLFGA